MRKILILVLLFIPSSLLFSQEKLPYTFGKITQADAELKVYKKDSSANAIFLYEHGKTTFHDTDRWILVRTKYYAKVKIFNKEGEDNATVTIPIYHNDRSSEKVTKIKAITHNAIVLTRLDKKNIFTKFFIDNKG